MASNLIPDIHVNSPFELDMEILKKKSIEGILVDIDNTLVPWSDKDPDQRVMDFVSKYSAAGFKLCIISNGTRNRVELFNRNLMLPYVCNAGKPNKRAFQKALKLIGTTPDKTAVIGDQIFTDILGGNRLGLFTVLVVPMSSKEFIWTRLVRQIEKRILRKYKNLLNKID